MNELLLILSVWFLSGGIGFVFGSILDHMFYKAKKAEWKWIPLCFILGPIMYAVILKIIVDLIAEVIKKENHG